MNNTELNLSIIVPVYNTEKYLEKCLNSILKNIPKNTEIIIVNDGSPDNSEDIIKKFKETYPDIIKYFKKQNGGLSDAKNFGISKAKGKYVTFVDSDDYVDENMHKEMLGLALEKDADAVYCDVELVYEDGKKSVISCTNTNRDTDYFKMIDTPLMAASWNKIVKKELYDGLIFPVGLNNEDIAITPILFGRAKSIYKIDKPFYKYFQRSGSIQNSGFNEKRFAVFDTAKICFKYSEVLPEDIQFQLRGSIYKYQMLDLLVYPISELSKEEQLRLIPLFCKKFNEFGDDPYKNEYVKEYIKNLHISLLLYLIKKEKIRTIILFLKLFNKFIRPR